uniref:Uncharacterized protein n=1 Tax=Arundo donax TaxID=35708 RepID=A0A0A8ZKI6_ARUDO
MDHKRNGSSAKNGKPAKNLVNMCVSQRKESASKAKKNPFQLQISNTMMQYQSLQHRNNLLMYEIFHGPQAQCITLPINLNQNSPLQCTIHLPIIPH